MLASFGRNEPFALVAFAAIVRMPTYVPGVAVVVQGRPADPSGVYAALLLPSERLARLHPGQPAYLDLGQDGARLRTTTVAVEPDIISPDADRNTIREAYRARRAELGDDENGRAQAARLNRAWNVLSDADRSVAVLEGDRPLGRLPREPHALNARRHAGDRHDADEGVLRDRQPPLGR